MCYGDLTVETVQQVVTSGLVLSQPWRIGGGTGGDWESFQTCESFEALSHL